MVQNSIFVIQPYRYSGLWVFDDEKVGLVHEPFVSGVDDIIDKCVANIEDADKGFNLLFSTIPFPGYNALFAHGWNYFDMPCCKLAWVDSCFDA